MDELRDELADAQGEDDDGNGSPEREEGPERQRQRRQRQAQRRAHRGDPGRGDRGRVPRRAARDQPRDHGRARTTAQARTARPVSRPSVLVCEVQQHLGDDRVRAVAMDSHRRAGPRHGGRSTPAARSRCPVGKATLGADLQPARRADRRGRPGRGARSAGRSTAPAPDVENLTAHHRDAGDRHQGDRPAGPLRQGRQGRPVRRRRRGQDRAHPGADPQHRRGARGPVGLLRRGRALARGQRPVAGDEGVGRDRQDDARLRADERAAGRAHAGGAVRA